MAHLHIGEIELSSTTGAKEALLPCQMPERSKLTLRLFDQYGVNCQKEEFQLKKGNSKLTLDCSQLESGDYSAWIELGGKTFLRAFSIQGEEKKKKKGLFQRVRNLIQPRQLDGAYH